MGVGGAALIESTESSDLSECILCCFFHKELGEVRK